MKAKANHHYFPVSEAEEEFLWRLRDPDLAARLADVRGILDLVAGSGATAADVEQALGLLEVSRREEGLGARFDNLEARLTARIEKGLAEIEGRLSKHLSAAAGPVVVAPTAPSAGGGAPTSPPPATTTRPTVPVVPPEANLAVRIGDEVVWGESAAQFYVAVWRWLFDHGRVRLADLPIGTAGKKRYEVSRSPLHPSGKEFYRAESPTPGAFLEVNLSRNDILRRARKYLAEYGVPHEVLVGPQE